MNIQSYLLLPVLLTSLFALSACGQKGPLYLPQTEQQAAAEATLAADAALPEDGEEKTEEVKE